MNFLIIARYTLLELIKSKIMANAVIIGAVICVGSYIGSEFTYGVPQRVSLDIGMGLLSLSLVGISIFLGANLIAKELENRTVYMVLSRPVSRQHFLMGKMLGLVSILFLNTLILGSITVIAYLFLGGELSSLIWWNILYSFLESMVTLLIVVLLSLISNMVITVLGSIFIYISAYSLETVKELSFLKSNIVLKTIADVFSYILPNFHKLNIKPFLIYQNELQLSFLINTLAYTVSYGLFLIFLISIIFKNKNLD